MEDKVQVSANLVKDLAKTSDEYGLFTVVVIMFVIALLASVPFVLNYLKAKELNTTLKSLADNVTILVQQYNNNISSAMAQSLIVTSFKGVTYELTELVKDIIDKNDIIKTRESIEARISLAVSTSFGEVKTLVAPFSYNRKILSCFINDKWSVDITMIIISIIYEANLTAEQKKRNASQYLVNAFKSIEFEFSSKLKES